MRAPEDFRVTTGPMRSDPSYGCNGAFVVRLPNGARLNVIASDEGGWEHVSVARSDRTPTWDEMCAIKDLFWGAEDCVVQYHPPVSAYVNNHPHCLHLWRVTDGREFPMPPAIMVGLPGVTL